MSLLDNFLLLLAPANFLTFLHACSLNAVKPRLNDEIVNEIGGIL